MADLQLVTAALPAGRVLDTAAVAASPGGDTAPAGPGRVLYVANGGASPVTVTAVTPGTYQGLALADAAMTVPAGAAGLLPLPRVLAGAQGRAALTYSGVDSVTVAVVEVAL